MRGYTILLCFLKSLSLLFIWFTCSLFSSDAGRCTDHWEGVYMYFIY